jgi:hypothetical protein
MSLNVLTQGGGSGGETASIFITGLDENSEVKAVRKIPAQVENPKWRGLPDGYTQFEYIESTGTQYIDTGISNMNVFGYEIEFQSMGIVNQDKAYKFDGVFGVNGTGTNADIKIWFNYANAPSTLHRIYCKSKNFDAPRLNEEEQYQTKHIASVKNGIVTFDGSKLGVIESFNTPTQKTTIHLFGVSDIAGASKFRSKTRIYSFKLYDESGNTIQNLKPCVRTADNKAGMYDEVSKQFFTNNGTGEFIIGV